MQHFNEHLDKRYGKIGTEKRAEFEIKAKSYAIGKIFREARKEAHMTQEELAKKISARKSFISRIAKDIMIYNYQHYIG